MYATEQNQPGDLTSAEHVEIRESGARTVQGQRVDIHQSGAQFVDGETVFMDKSGAITIRAREINLDKSGAVFAAGEVIQLQPGSSASVIAAQRVDGAQIRTGVLLAREVYGNVETAMDTRTGLVIGLGFGLGIGLLLSLKSLFGGKE